jgi:DNA-binding IclR family transcriptional regulator
MIQSVDRAISVLMELQGARRLGLTDLASRLGLANSTVHGIVATLVARGMVEQDPSGRYALGVGVLRLGNVYLDSNELRLRSGPWAETLTERTGYAVRVGVLAAEHVLVLHHILRPDGSRQMLEIGVDIPAHGTALGKALLAYHPDPLGVLPPDTPLPRLTGCTIVDLDVLDRELAKIRVDGIAHAQDEIVLSESEVAAPIFDSQGTAVGAIGVVLPTSELPADDLVVGAVRQAAISISRELGATTWPGTPSDD